MVARLLVAERTKEKQLTKFKVVKVNHPFPQRAKPHFKMQCLPAFGSAERFEEYFVWSEFFQILQWRNWRAAVAPVTSNLLPGARANSKVALANNKAARANNNAGAAAVCALTVRGCDSLPHSSLPPSALIYILVDLYHCIFSNL
jgi:hypothetical protein